MVNVVKKLKDAFKIYKDEIEKLWIKHIYVFGSYANNTYSANSDIDVLIEADTDNLTWDIYWLFYDIEKKVNIKLDIWFYDSLKDSIKRYLKKEDLIKLI